MEKTSIWSESPVFIQTGKRKVVNLLRFCPASESLGKPRVIERYDGSGTEIPYKSTTYYESGYKAAEFTYDDEGNALTESHWEDGE